MNYKKVRDKIKSNRHRRALKKKLVDYKGGSCEICGYKTSMRAMQFHHTDPNEKEFGIGRRTVSSIDKLKTELDKCQLLCSNCHAEIHEKISLKNDEDLEKIINVPKRDGKRKCVSCENRFIFNGDKKCLECRVSLEKIKEERKNRIKNKRPRFKINWPENLKELIWSKPLTKLSKELNVSDNAIRKRCIKLGIQLPPKGYWLRK